MLENEIEAGRLPLRTAIPGGGKYRHNFIQRTQCLKAVACVLLLLFTAHFGGDLSAANIVVWGKNPGIPSQLGSFFSNIVQVAAGPAHALLMDNLGRVVAWGDNQYGQLNVPGGWSAKAIAAGNHSLALTTQKLVAAWGHNTYGQANVPSGLKDVQAIAAGTFHSLALTSDGQVVAWGRNTEGQVDVPPGLTNVVYIAAGERNSLAITAGGTLVIWGDNSAGQCNDPGGLGPVKMAAVGFAHALALKADGTVVAWGDNSYGQADVSRDLADVIAVQAAKNTSLALKSDGSVVLWGQNTWEQNRQVELLSDVKLVSTAGDYGLAVVERPPEPPPTADSFNANLGAQLIRCISIQPDGKILVGGIFTNVTGPPRRNLTRLNPDGTVDSSFNPQTGSEGQLINAVVVQPSGHILIGGAFESSGPEPRTNFARLLSDGTLDAGFKGAATDPVVSFAAPTVESMAIDTSGRTILGGSFGKFAGQPRACLARLNPDGNLDESFNPGADYVIRAIAIQPDNKILVSGKFTVLAGRKCTNLGRLNPDGTYDDSFNAVEIAGGAVETINIQTDGKIILGGGFEWVARQPRRGLVRLQQNGNLDPTFNFFAGSVASVAVQADGRLLVLSSLPWDNFRPALLRVESDGTIESSFVMIFRNTDRPQCLALQDDGKILVGGSFTSLAGQDRSGLGRLITFGPAKRKLSFSASSVVWQKGGAAPEFWHASFAYSTNGVNWIGPLPAEPAVGSWKRSGLSLPVNAQIRAQGYIAGGPGGSSGSVVESSINGAPRVSHFGFGPTGFNFSLTTLPGVRYSLEYTESLPTGPWRLLRELDGSGTTQTATDYFIQSPARFYRVNARWQD